MAGLDSRVGLVSRICPAWGDQIRRSEQSGGPEFFFGGGGGGGGLLTA